MAEIAGFIGSVNLADEVARLMFAVWPRRVASPIASEIHNVLTTTRGGVKLSAQRLRSISPRAASKSCASGSFALTAFRNTEVFGCCGWT